MTLAEKAIVGLSDPDKYDLDSNDIQVCKSILRSESKKSFYFFAKHVVGLSKLSDDTHKVWCDDIQDNWDNTENFMRLKPRGTYKTSVFGIALILWIWATKSQEVRIFYTSNSSLLLQEVSDTINKQLEDQFSLCRQVFGLARDSESKNTNEIFNLTGRGNGKGFSLVMRTSGGSTNGVHPNVIIVDDPCDRPDRESAAIRRRKELWYNSLIPLLVPYENDEIRIYHKMYIATRWHMDDLTNYVMKMDQGEWDISIEGVLNKDGTPRYPSIPTVGTLEAIEKLKRTMDDAFFACQYLNEVIIGDLQKFPKERLHFYSTHDITLGKNFCFLDPSRGKKESDYPAVIWINFYKNTCRLFDAIDEKIPLADLLKIIAKKNMDSMVVEMIFEDNGTSLIEETLIKEHQELGYHIGITAIHETQNKEARIIAMQPQLFSGFFQFREDYEKAYPEAMNQLVFFPAWGNDDFPDVIQKAVSHLAPFVGMDQNVFDSTGERVSLKDYA